ncbi:MAG: ABC transporter substrate-binding protein [Alphaproteobacteria bacterium]|jgi:ABC-type transporter MlaC component|nr:ABC transporter substrate-binding protein [Alphaproteobacteria bacterium]
MFKIIQYYLILLIVPLNLYSEENLEQWFSKMTGDFFEIIQNDNKMQLENKLILFIDDKFAIKSISLSLIGRLAKKNSKEELEKYQKAFLTHLTKTIYNLVERYEGQLIQLEKIKKDENGYLIYSTIEDENKSYSIVWRIAYILNEPKVLDVIIENSSYYVSKKSEFSQILRENKGDLSKLTKTLEHVSFN